jgi:putative Holliday junction resolvase
VTRLLGLDLGERRVGVALADPDGRAIPHTTLDRAPTAQEDAARLGRIVAQERITELVVGLPLNADGTLGPQAEIARTWAEDVATRLGLPLAMRDERLSSHLAEQRLGPMKRGRSGGPPTRSQRNAYRARVDREAAAIILQDELDARAHGRAQGEGA